jgi:hypothetical protein
MLKIRTMEKKDYKKMSKAELIRRLEEMDRKPGYSIQRDLGLHTGTASMTFPPFFTQIFTQN